MSKSCKGLLKELVKCLRESDCMQKVRSATGASVGASHWLGGAVLARTDRRPAPSTPRCPTHPSGQEHKDIKTCAQEVKECEGLRNSYAACKRGQVDARSRLRGNKGY